MPSPDHLIIVCGHAIWLGGPQKGWAESEWLIESYKRGETPTFIEHIRAGVKALAEDERAVLVFTGGPTRPETQLSEARSYGNLAAANDYFSYFGAPSTPTSPPTVTSRILLEERALDSYHNILFSLVVFWRHARAWPARLTIVSHAFKRARLVDAHCAAIGFPLRHVRFCGIDPPALARYGAEAADIAAAAAASASAPGTAVPSEMADVQAVVGQWARDPHGVGAELAGKRRKRNCWGVDQRLFMNGEERARSGVHTVVLPGGEGEALDPDAPRPWAEI